MKVVIVGGVAGGATTAARLRRQSEEVEIVMFERGSEISYANCGIPYYIGGVIKNREDLVVVSEEDFKKQFKTDVRTNSEVVSIDRKNKKVKVKDLRNNNIYEESYDKLVLSPGGYPVRPPIPGINDPRIFTVRNLHDMDLIRSFINEKKPKKAIVVGGGFIGLELAENLHNLGMLVSVVELAGQVMNLLDYEMATVIHQHLKSNKIELYLKDAVKEFSSVGGKIEAVLGSGRKISSDMVILSIGIKPEAGLAKEAGLTIGGLGGIKVNSRLETNDPDIYALGDATEINEIVSDSCALIPLANSANKQGRIVADNIIGKAREYKGTPGTAIAKVFDITAAITGLSEKSLKAKGIEYSKAYLQPSSHAGYYPDAYPMVFKLLFCPKDGKVMGAQIIGKEGVDKRIDVVSSLVQLGRTVYDMAELELSYAPPYSSAKDPVNLAGMIAVNQIEGNNPVVFLDELDKLKKEGAVLLDVRTSLEYNIGHIDGSVSMPLSELRQGLSDVPKDKKVIVYCNQGKTAYYALRVLKNLGYHDVCNLSGGFKLYKFVSAQQENVGIFDGNFVDKTDELRSVVSGQGTVFYVDATGIQCPGPIMRLAGSLEGKEIGAVIEITATDPGFKNDVDVWCKTTGNTLLSMTDKEGKITARVQKGRKMVTSFTGDIPHDKTIVVFSSDMDRAIAAFVIANGGLSLGRKVTMFFTFWGLNILRKKNPPRLKKDIFEKMFGIMMPRGTFKLKLSQMNFFGIGPKLIRFIMKRKNIDSLETFIDNAIKGGARIVACQMSMDMMGIKKEELIDGVEIGGVAAYLGAAENSDNNLFI